MMIYFDNAATGGKKPQAVINAVRKALTDYSANPGRSGHRLSIKAAEVLYKAREKTAEFFNATSPENVIFTSGCTESINFVLKGVINSGDHIVISNLEHNAVKRPLTALGNNYTEATVDFFDNEKTFQSFKNAVRKDTKLVFCTAASNVTGRALPLEKIGNFCRKEGILFGVDAAQGGGILPIDIKKMCIDFLCLAPHKALFSPMGLGVLIAEKPIEKTIIEGGTGSHSIMFEQPLEMPERFESGTPNLPAVMGYLKGLEFLERIGREKIYTHELKIAQYIYEELSRKGEIELYTPYPKMEEYVAVIPFNFKGINSQEIASYLDKNGIAVRGGYHCAPTAHKAINTMKSGAVRLSFSPFNNFFEAKEFLRVITLKKK